MALPKTPTKSSGMKWPNFYWVGIVSLNDLPTTILDKTSIKDPANWLAGIAENKVYISPKYGSITSTPAEVAETTLANGDLITNPLGPTKWLCSALNTDLETLYDLKEAVAQIDAPAIYFFGKDVVLGQQDPNDNDPNAILPIPLLNAPVTTDTLYLGQTAQDENKTSFATEPKIRWKFISGTSVLSSILPK